MGIMNGLKNSGAQDCPIATARAAYFRMLSTLFWHGSPAERASPGCGFRTAGNSVKYASCKDRKAVTADLKDIYLAPSAGATSDSPEKFAEKWAENIRPFQNHGGVGGTRLFRL
jgi:transposase-like protein